MTVDHMMGNDPTRVLTAEERREEYEHYTVHRSVGLDDKSKKHISPWQLLI